MLDIDVIVVEFGYWATPRHETEFPRVAAGFAEMKCEARYAHKYRINSISDDLGLRIDGYLGIIRKLTPELYDVFVLTYIKRWENFKSGIFQPTKNSKNISIVNDCERWE